MLPGYFNMTGIFLIVLTLLVLQGGFFVFGSPSVCPVLRSRVSSRWVSYQEVYTKRKWGMFKKVATRVNYRWEHFTDWNRVDECCLGYEPQGIQTSTCYPTCRSGCHNGRCIRPNECTCDSGYRTVLTDGQSRCVPHCMDDGPEGCGDHGLCIAPNTCVCRNGYSLTITHTNGELTSGLPCIPKCKTMCGKNSLCASPNNCACNVGYTRIKTEKLTDDSFTCEPSCVPECGENMNCFAPDKCQCDAGYISVPSLDVNFARNADRPDTCLPVCDPPCIEGTCTRPGYCVCHRGYQKMSASLLHECSPICDPPCLNANCTRPHYCECHNGYEKSSTHLPQVCSPLCDPPCMNGICTKPGYCECHKGYKKYLKSSSQACFPDCDPPCINATCIQPNSCECHVDYEKKLGGLPQVCSPICNPGCDPNAFCDAPNKCLCNTGYTVASISSFSITTANSLQTTGKSTFSFNEISCKPVCEPECKENESCVAPNVCQCDPGYRPDIVKANLTQCLPICEPSCVNAYCGHPNKCICLSGYTQSLVKDFVCDPVCQDGCFNASCTLPNHCECYEGYEKALIPTESPEAQGISENTCVPSCPGQCSNGTCIAPGQCLCDPGYVLNSTLIPATSDETTTEYAEDSNSTTINDTFIQFCQPFCEPGCPIGSECLAPNQCEPQPDDSQDFNGFSINSTYAVNSTEDCGRNGDFLDENDQCVCKYGWTGWRCEKPLLCGFMIRASFENDEKSTTLQSIIVRSNDTIEPSYDDISDMRMISSDDESGVLIDWQGPMCMEECRIFMTSSEMSGNRSDEAVSCYLLESENATTGVLSIRDQVLRPASKNGTFVCFISIGSKCNVPKLEIVGGKFESLIGGIIGAIILLALITVVGLGIYCRKKRLIGVTPGVSMSNSTMLIHPESMYSLHTTEESSTL